MKKKLLQTFIELIKINEVYPDEKEVIEYVQTYLQNLGVAVKQDSFHNIIAYIPGQGEPLMLNAHLDIPENVDNLDYTIKGDVVSGTGKSILGADDKSGLAVLLELATYIVTNKTVTRPIELVLTRGEESGMLGAEHLDFSLIQSKVGLVVDEDGPYTSLVKQAPGNYKFDIKIIGKIVHPRDHAEGINALEIAIKALSKLQQGEIMEGVTFNVGTLSAGTARNTVPGICTMEIELRSFDTEKLLTAVKKVEAAFKAEIEKRRGAKMEINGWMSAPAYEIKLSDPFFKLLEDTYTSLNAKPNVYSTYGCSDANVFNKHGITALPIGSAYYNAHQYIEYVNIQEMGDLLHFFVKLVRI